MAARVDLNIALKDLTQSTRAAFLSWNRKHREFWPHFDELACRAASRGKKIGAKAIAERVRWELIVEEPQEEMFAQPRNRSDFAVNNSFVSYYARIWQEKYKNKYPDFFELREIKGLLQEAA